MGGRLSPGMDVCRIQKKPGASSRLSTGASGAGAHTANEADADMSDSPLTSHTTTGVGGSVSVKKANQLLIPSLSIKATARKQSEEGEEERRLSALLLVWNTNGLLSSVLSDSSGAENRPLFLVLACLVNKTFCK